MTSASIVLIIVAIAIIALTITLVLNLVRNTRTVSTTNTYSCDYINAKFDDILNDVITNISNSDLTLNGEITFNSDVLFNENVLFNEDVVLNKNLEVKGAAVLENLEVKVLLYWKI